MHPDFENFDPNTPPNLPPLPKRKTSSFTRFLLFLAAILTILILFLYFTGIGTTPIIKTTTHSASANGSFSCKRVQQTTSSSKEIVLRIDDIQAYGWSNIGIKMMQDAIAHNFPLVAAVIPLNLDKNPTLLHFLDLENCNIEIAMHGYTHQIPQNGQMVPGPEFGDISQAEAAQKIKTGEAILFKNLPFLTKDNLTTFIPPNNVMSAGSIQAVKDAGFTVISAQGSGPYDYDASSENYTSRTFSNAQDIINECNTTFKTKNFCVIMVHPQNYADTNGNLDTTKYQSYTNLLNDLQKSGYTLTTFQKLSGS